MPALEGLIARGSAGSLTSTVPTYTPPAWISMTTGVNPGKHGIFGFLSTTAQDDTSLVAHSGLIGAPSLWDYANHNGLRMGVFNVPMTYPPTPVEGFMISGGLAAGWTNTEMPNFSSDPDSGLLALKIGGGHYPLDTVVSYENDWKGSAAIKKIEEVQRLRRRVLKGLLMEREVDAVFAVFEGPDRLQHLHYQYLVPFSGWYDRPEAGEMRDLANSYFTEVDRGIADIAEWAGDDGHVIVVSDHGFGPWEKTLNVNLLLNEWGYLKLPNLSKLTRLRPISGKAQQVARRVLPRRVLQAAKARVGRAISWNETSAFASHVAEQGIHVNTRADLPKGWLNAARAERVQNELVERLLSLTDDSDSAPVVDKVVRRAEVIHGSYASRAPHLFPFCRDQRYELSDTLAASSILTDHRDRPWGYHHSEGIFVAAGPGVVAGRLQAAPHIVDVAPTVLHLLGLGIPESLDGHVITEALSGSAAHEPRVGEELQPHEPTSEYPFSPEEEESIEENLRALGYVE